MQKKFMLALAIAALASGSLAAQGTSNDPSAAMRRAFAGVAENVTKSAEMVPADKWNYTPIASVRTFAQQIAHIADSHNYYCAQVSGAGGQWSDPVEKGTLDKATLMQKLRTSIETCAAAYSGPNARFGPMADNIGHTNLHYGNLVTYLRMLGLTPPSS